MAKTKKRPIRKSQPEKASRRMQGVRPLRGKPAIAARYEHGFKPPEGDPWIDEGRPETAG